MRKRTTARARRIAELNDRLRKNPADRSLGQVLMSAGLAALGDDFKGKALAMLKAMEPKDFKKGNDPYGERDFNSFSVDGRLCFYKIDYYARDDMRRGSEDPADPDKTARVMTLMLAEDY